MQSEHLIYTLMSAAVVMGGQAQMAKAGGFTMRLDANQMDYLAKLMEAAAQALKEAHHAQG